MLAEQFSPQFWGNRHTGGQFKLADFGLASSGGGDIARKLGLFFGEKTIGATPGQQLFHFSLDNKRVKVLSPREGGGPQSHNLAAIAKAVPVKDDVWALIVSGQQLGDEDEEVRSRSQLACVRVCRLNLIVDSSDRFRFGQGSPINELEIRRSYRHLR